MVHFCRWLAKRSVTRSLLVAQGCHDGRAPTGPALAHPDHGASLERYSRAALASLIGVGSLVAALLVQTMLGR